MPETKYHRVKRHYENGYWSLRQVREAVEDGWITAEEYTVITGEPYTKEDTE